MFSQENKAIRQPMAGEVGERIEFLRELVEKKISKII